MAKCPLISEYTGDRCVMQCDIIMMQYDIIMMQYGLLLSQHAPGMLCRIIGTGAIFHKIFELSQTTIGETSIGRIVNLASTDVQRFDLVSFGYLCHFSC